MTRARIVSRDGVEEVSGREFYTRAFGHAPRTRAEREAEYRADCERYADMIEAGNEWAVPCPCLADARRIVAERNVTATVERDLRFTIELQRKDKAA